VIVVIGLPAYADSPDGEKCAGGLAVEIAAAAVRRGGTVELVGKIGNDGAGDAVVVALGRMGVGHAALLRDAVLPTPVFAAVTVDEDAAELDSDVPAGRLLPEDPAARPALEAADIDLALKFLPQAGVVVLAGPLPESAVAAAVDGVAFAGARLIVLVAPGYVPAALPAETTVLETPSDDDGSFGRMVGTFAGALEAGVEPGTAFREAVGSAGWEPVAE
jgi:sugar/nucleoside kinase (ribokinase family)